MSPEDDRTIKERAWQVIETLARAERRRDPTLTRERAIAKAIESTPDGRAAAELYMSRAADQTVAAATAAQRAIGRRRQLGFGNWAAAVDLQARVIADRDQIDYTSALAKVEKEYPETWRAYLTERA